MNLGRWILSADMTGTRNPYAVLVCGDRDKGGREERTAVGKTGERTDRAGNKRLGRGQESGAGCRYRLASEHDECGRAVQSTGAVLADVVRSRKTEPACTQGARLVLLNKEKQKR